MQNLPLHFSVACCCVLLGTASCKQPKLAFGMPAEELGKPSETATPKTPSFSETAFTFVGPKARPTVGAQ